MSGVVEAIEKFLSPILEAENVELVDITYQKAQGAWTLCLALDKPGGITLEDCEYWTHKLSPALDEVNLIPHSYNLEISSPGLYRPLKRLKDFKRFIGQRVYVKLFSPLEGQKQFRGILKEANEEAIQLELSDNRQVRLSLAHVAKSNLDPIVNIQ